MREPDTIGLEVACDLRDGVTAYLNQHWIPGSPRRPALVQSSPETVRNALKQALGAHLFKWGSGSSTAR